jgi:hypothetical protein
MPFHVSVCIPQTIRDAAKKEHLNISEVCRIALFKAISEKRKARHSQSSEVNPGNVSLMEEL